MEDIISAISTVGFPIYACGVMFLQQKELNQAIVKLSTTLEKIDQRITMIERGLKD